MRNTIVSSIILGGALVLSSLFISGEFSTKKGNVINVVDGAVKLGEVYSEDDIVSARIEFENDSNEVLFENVGPSEAADKLQQRLKAIAEQINTGVKDPAKKATAESISAKVPGKVIFTSAVKYRAEFQPSFTLTLERKEVELAANEKMLSTVKAQLEIFLDKQKTKFSESHFLK
ncbi:hypothetical protein [Erwinia rhapontici]|uniref:hypothetical protein n=1 Tax=Erwinia rhapontici TaxID=55212 RepID=UPI0013312D53|nr:hypothetical protein [Erwinia rhapontici]MBP2155369.1 hypothetical protein [Erwinia rhapontici]